MPLRLILSRHCKSSWADANQTDHERPLNKRGRRAATALGRWLVDTENLPNTVLSSDARRTRETWAGMAAELPVVPDVEWVSALYLASPDTLLEAIRPMGTVSPLLVMAHNPGIATMASQLAADLPEHPEFARYPTGATTVFEVPVNDWSTLEWRQSTVSAVVVPRELE